MQTPLLGDFISFERLSHPSPPGVSTEYDRYRMISRRTAIDLWYITRSSLFSPPPWEFFYKMYHYTKLTWHGRLWRSALFFVFNLRRILPLVRHDLEPNFLFLSSFSFRFGTTCEIELRGRRVASHVVIYNKYPQVLWILNDYPTLYAAAPVWLRQHLPFEFHGLR